MNLTKNELQPDSDKKKKKKKKKKLPSEIQLLDH